MQIDTIKITVNHQTFTAVLEHNSSAEALVELLSKGNISVDMEDYARMEKVGPLKKSLPRNDKAITAVPCDLILYQGNQLVIYYNPNSWTFTRLGRIIDTTRDELVSALGRGDVTVILSLDEK